MILIFSTGIVGTRLSYKFRPARIKRIDSIKGDTPLKVNLSPLRSLTKLARSFFRAASIPFALLALTLSAAAQSNYVRTRLPAETKVVAGYWHNFGNGSSVMRLNEVPDRYNVVYIAFAESQVNDRATMIFTPSTAIPGQTTAIFKADVLQLQARGTKVIISLGGANAFVTLNTEVKKMAFVSSMVAMIDEYNFDGIDIDIEAGTFVLDSGDTDFNHPTTPAIVNLIDATRQICAHYQGALMLTSAPETAYVQGAKSAYAGIWGAYMPWIEGVRDILDYIHPQYYNAGGLSGLDNHDHGPATSGFLTAGCELLLKGFNVGGNAFTGLRPDQVAIGIPASPAAGGSFIALSQALSAVKYLESGDKAASGYTGSYTLQKVGGYPSFRGIMTWSVNWDKTTNGGTAVYEFANLFSAHYGTGSAALNVSDASVTEGDSGTRDLIFTVTLPRALDTVVTVDYATSDDTAVAGTDYSAQTGSLTFAVGEISKTIAVPVWGDTVFSMSKSFTLTLSHATGTSIADGVATGTIINDDSSGAAPLYGLSTLAISRPLVMGYVNTLRNASGAEQLLTPAQVTTEIQGIHWAGYDLIIHAFAEPVASDASVGEGLATFKAYQADLIREAHARGKSVVLSVGGAYPGRIANQFYTLASNPTQRALFVANLVAYVGAQGYDGVDIDWEFPDAGSGKAALTQLMAELHTALKTQNQDYIVMFGTGPGWFLGSYDFSALKNHCDFFFYFGYDWKNNANGPIKKPGSGPQWTTAGDTLFEQSVRGGLQYILNKGFPAQKIICGLPFYGSNNTSWSAIRPTWAADQAAYDAAIDPNSMEVLINGAWFTSPKALKMKMDALLQPVHSVLGNAAVLRGVGTWEIGHEHRSHPDLSQAFAEWTTDYTAALGWIRPYQEGAPGNISLETWKTTHTITDITGDLHGNGLPDIIDFLIGNTPSTGGGISTPIHVDIRSLNIDGTIEPYFSVVIDLDPSAANVEYRIERSNDLQTWEAGESIMLIHAATSNSNGTQRVVWRSAMPIGDAPVSQFARLTARSVTPE